MEEHVKAKQSQLKMESWSIYKTCPIQRNKPLLVEVQVVEELILAKLSN